MRITAPGRHGVYLRNNVNRVVSRSALIEPPPDKLWLARCFMTSVVLVIVLVFTLRPGIATEQPAVGRSATKQPLAAPARRTNEKVAPQDRLNFSDRLQYRDKLKHRDVLKLEHVDKIQSEDKLKPEHVQRIRVERDKLKFERRSTSGKRQ